MGDLTPAVAATDLLEQVISNSLFAADTAVIDAHSHGEINVPADATRIAVSAAIRNAVANGALKLSEDQPDWWRIDDPDRSDAS